MGYRATDSDTICASATPLGVGGIGVIRLSGPNALVVFKKVIRQDFSNKSNEVKLYKIFGQDEELLDEALVSYFAKGKSYTGEETVEISHHGSPIIARAIQRELIRNGARPAGPGEFTYRAFINGKIDLVQAESVLAAIEATSESSAKMAVRNIKGQLSQDIVEVEQEITKILAQLEANLDFAEENLSVEGSESLAHRLETVLERVGKLLNSYNKGRALRSGLRVVIAGEPNVGKSSLLNALLGEERAIVSAVPGTTRDVIDSEIFLEGMRLELVDTAGVRATEDEVEKIGVEKSLKEQAEADIVIQVLDATNIKTQVLPNEKNLIRVVNKVDLINQHDAALKCNGVLVSAKDGVGISELKKELQNLAEALLVENQSAVLFQSRHFDLLTRAQENLKVGLRLLTSAESPEFVIAEVHAALLCFYDILGKTYDDQVMDRVFKDFCVGK
jgi:tRNA modification GTPase